MKVTILLLALVGLCAADTKYYHLRPTFHAAYHYPATFTYVKPAAVQPSAQPAVLQYSAPAAAVQYKAPTALQYSVPAVATHAVAAPTLYHQPVYAFHEVDDDDDVVATSHGFYRTEFDDDDDHYVATPFGMFRSSYERDDDAVPKSLLPTTYAKLDFDDDHYEIDDHDDRK